MATWNFNIDVINDSAKMKEKLKKIKKSRGHNLRHNPKNIPIFENIFESEYSKNTIQPGPILEKPILQYEPIYTTKPPKRKGESRWFFQDDTESSSNVVEGMVAVLGIDDNTDSLTNLYNKIKSQNESSNKKTDLSLLEKASENAKKVTGKPELLNSGSSNFLFPGSSIADLPNHEKANDTNEMDAKKLLGIAQSKADSIVNKASGLSNETDTISSQIYALKKDIKNKKLFNNSPIPDETPESKEQASIEVKGFSDQLKKGIKKGIDELKYILKVIFEFFGKQLKLGMIYFSYFISHLRDSINYFVIIVANALTNNNATVSEVKIFYSEMVKFATILFTYIFLYNWYYYLFYLCDGEDDNNCKSGIARITLDFFKFFEWGKGGNKNPSPLLYTIFGPSFMPTVFFDIGLTKLAGYMKEYIPSKPILFFTLALIFFTLVLGDLQSEIIMNFISAFTFKRTASLLSILMFVTTLGFGLHWIGMSGMFQKASGMYGLPGIGALLGCLVLSVMYLIYIFFFAAPIGMICFTSYIMIYSFFAIIIYSWLNNGVGIINDVQNGGIYGVITSIYNEVIKKEGDEGEQQGGEQQGGEQQGGEQQGGEYQGGEQQGGDGENESIGGIVGKSLAFINNAFKGLYAFIEKYVIEANKYLVELFIILILLSGIETYTTNYGAIVFDKTTSQTVNSIGSPVSNAFKHLFTWLIIINVLIILFTGVRMWGKYYKLKQESEGDGNQDNV
jgi:hypothetical protein